jgi:hypothetical protein
VFAVSVRVAVAMQMLLLVVMPVVVSLFKGLRTPRKDDVPMRCCESMAVNTAAMPVG